MAIALLVKTCRMKTESSDKHIIKTNKRFTAFSRKFSSSKAKKSPKLLLPLSILLLSLFLLRNPAYFALKKFSIRFQKNREVDAPSFDDHSDIDGILKENDAFNLHDSKQVSSANNGSCLSLKESSFYYPPPSIPSPSPSLLKALRRHEKMQKKCVNGVKNWKKHFLKSKKGFESCKYIIWEEDGNGLGNKFLSIASAFSYAILTHRALLIHSKYLHLLLCDPFPETSWWLLQDVDMIKFPSLPSILKIRKNKKKFTKAKVVLQHNYVTKEDKMDHFFCDYAQNELKDVRLFLFYSSQYIIPSLFIIPMFAEKLNSFFPHGLAIPYLVRYLFQPNNQVWERVIRLYHAYYSPAHLTVAVQIRTHGNYDQNISQRVFECINSSNIFPPSMSNVEYQLHLNHRIQSKKEEVGSAKPGRFGESRKIISMFVASLNIGYYDDLKLMYDTMLPMKDGSTIVIHFGSHNNVEVHDLEKDEMAMVEIWLLSMSDVLFQSKWSTFGYIANALGAQKSYYMDTNWGVVHANVANSCQLSKSSEACLHVYPVHLTCPSSSPFNLSMFGPNLDVCQDYVNGMSLVPRL